MRKRKRAKNALLPCRLQRGSGTDALQMLPLRFGGVEGLPTFPCLVQCACITDLKKHRLMSNETMNLIVHPDLDYCILSMLMGFSLEAS